MSTQQHYTRVLDRFGDQATALDGEAVKAEAQARQLTQLITTGQQQRAQVATAIADLERQKADLERELQERQVRLAALDEDLAAKQGALEDAQCDAGDYRAEAVAIREIVAQQVATLERQNLGAAATRTDGLPGRPIGAIESCPGCRQPIGWDGLGWTHATATDCTADLTAVSPQQDGGRS